MAHVIALIESDEDINVRDVLQAREFVVQRYLRDADERRIDWTPKGGVVDRRER
jgi:hypothetical protein